MAQTDTHPDQRAPTPGLVCAHCRYDLRGAAAGGRCPECGAGVPLLSVDDPLGAADRQWLGRLARGQTLLTWALRICVPAAASLLFLAVGASIVSALTWRPWATGERLAMTLAVGLGLALLAASILGTAGTFLLTSSEPGYWGHWRMRRVRAGARIASVVTLAVMLPVVPALVMASARHVPGGAVVLLLMLAMNAAIVNVLLLLPWQMHLVNRVADESLIARMCTHQLLLIGGAAAFDLSIVILLVVVGGAVAAAALLVVVGSLIALLIAGIGMAKAFHECRVHFRNCIPIQ